VIFLAPSKASCVADVDGWKTVDSGQELMHFSGMDGDGRAATIAIWRRVLAQGARYEPLLTIESFSHIGGRSGDEDVC